MRKQINTNNLINESEDYQRMLKAMKNDKTYKELSKVAKQCGYNLVSIYKDTWGSTDKEFIEIDIRPVEKYAPDIRYEDPESAYGDKLGCKAQTTAFGSLGEKDYKEFAEQIQKTAKLVEYINKIDKSSVWSFKD